MNERNRQSRRRRQSRLVVTALALALALSTSAAAPRQNAAPGQDPERTVARAFAKLDNIVDTKGCVRSSTVRKMDQLFIDLHDWDARSLLHSAVYPVCTLSAGR